MPADDDSADAGFAADAQVPVVTAVGPSRGLGAFGFGSQLRALLGAAGEDGDLGGQAAIMGTLQAVAQVLPELAQDLGPFAALERRELEAPLALLPYEVTIR